MENVVKFDLLSDLHLDVNRQNPFILEPNEGSNILVLAGDLAEENFLRQTRYLFIRDALQMYKRVIYVTGNHEYYGANYQMANDRIAEAAVRWGFDFLHGSAVEIEGVLFMGGVTFTDMNNRDVITMETVRNGLNDFVYITYGEEMDRTLAIPDNDCWTFGGQQTHVPKYYENRRIIKPGDYVNEYEKFMKYFDETAEANKDKKIVLVTHHALSEKSVMPRFFTDYHMNGGYRSKADAFFEKHKNVVVHCHGHMHDFIRYELANAKVVCNPRGYVRYNESGPNYGPYQVEVKL